MTNSQAKLDPKLTTAQANAVTAAYKDYNGKKWSAPSGYDFVGRFYGWATIAGAKVRAKYGLIFKEKKNNRRILVAFRGTQSVADIYNDLWANLVHFDALKGKVAKNVKVADGFFSIYAGRGPAGQPSMRDEVFGKIGVDTLESLSICGHSLGGTFASMCALDVKVANRDLPIQTTTFASPAVGNKAWEQLYIKAGLASATARIYNYWDYVPSMPPFDWFKHVGRPFQINTWVKGAWVAHLDSRHSMDNYKYVVTRAVKNTPQVWVGEYPDAAHKGWTMVSKKPKKAAQPNWAKEHKAFETMMQQTSKQK